MARDQEILGAVYRRQHEVLKAALDNAWAIKEAAGSMHTAAADELDRLTREIEALEEQARRDGVNF